MKMICPPALGEMSAPSSVHPNGRKTRTSAWCGAILLLLARWSALAVEDVPLGQTVTLRSGPDVGHLSEATAGFNVLGTLRMEAEGSYTTQLSITSGELSIGATGLFEIPASQFGFLGFTGNIRNQGLFRVDFPLTVSGPAQINNLGSVTIGSGSQLLLNSGAGFRQQSGSLTIPDGGFRLDGGVFDFVGGDVNGLATLPTATLKLSPGSGTGSFAVGGANASVTGEIQPGQSVVIPGNPDFGHTTINTGSGLTNRGLLTQITSGTYNSQLIATQPFVNGLGAIWRIPASIGQNSFSGSVLNLGLMDFQSPLLLEAPGGITNRGILRLGAEASIVTLGIPWALRHEAGSLEIANPQPFSSVNLDWRGGALTGRLAVFNSTLRVAPAIVQPYEATLLGLSRWDGSIRTNQQVNFRADGLAGHASVEHLSPLRNDGRLTWNSLDTYTLTLDLANTIVTNGVGGVISSAPGSQIVVNGGLRNEGRMDLLSTVNIRGTNSTWVTSGELNLGPNSILNVEENLIEIGGLIRMGGGSLAATADGADLLIQAGTLEGGGTLQLEVFNAGVVDAGSSSARTLTASQFIQSAAGSLLVDLGGTQPGINHDTLVTIGPASLDGTLKARLDAGFIPIAGHEFTILSNAPGNASLTGRFAALDLPGLTGSLGWTVQYTELPAQVVLRVVQPANANRQILGSVKTAGGTAVPNARVTAFSTTAEGQLFRSTVTTANGSFVLAVPTGSWQVSVANLPDLGYQPAAIQSAVIAASDVTLTFVAAAAGLQEFQITTDANPAVGGSVSGGGKFSTGQSITLHATPNTTTLPYRFVAWTESGVVQSTDANYTFTATRNRQLIAQFDLPRYAITVEPIPTAGGSITGAAEYIHGTTVHLEAFPVFGYAFDHWSEGATTISSSAVLEFLASRTRSLVAHFRAIHLIHVVTTETSPADLAIVPGAGSYANGESAQFNMPFEIVRDGLRHAFQGYWVNGGPESYETNYSRLFATTDPTNVTVTAVYQPGSLLPAVWYSAYDPSALIRQATMATVSIYFDRSMDPSVIPAIIFANPSGNFPKTTNGTWQGSSYPNDTFVSAPFAVTAAMAGNNVPTISGARDPQGRVMAPAELPPLVLDGTAPVISAIGVVTRPDGATITFSVNEDAVAEINYGLDTTYGQTPFASGVAAGTYNADLVNLQADTLYHFRIRATDSAGNVALTTDQILRTPAVPDLQLTSLTVPANARNGQVISIQWTVRNAGPGPAAGEWSDAIYLADTAAGGGSQLLLSQPNPGAIAAGQTVARTAQITIPSFETGDRWIVVHTDFGDSLFEGVENNNTRVSTTPLRIASGLVIQGDAPEIAEHPGANPLGFTVSRNGTLTAPLTVNLVSSDTLHLTVPASVVIPAGAESTRFVANLLDDALNTGNLHVSVTAQAAGVEQGTSVVTILDDDPPALSLTLSKSTVAENAGGNAATGSVSRNTATNGPLSVGLASSDSPRLLLPVNVTIPAGARSFDFPVGVVDNGVPNAPVAVTLTAAATNHADATAALVISDNDTPRITLELPALPLREGSDNPVGEGIARREAPSPGSSLVLTELKLVLSTTGSDLVSVPRFVSLADGETFVRFPINLANDDRATGPQTVLITAKGVDPDSGDDLPGAVAQANISVEDDDSPSLTLSLDREVIGETGVATAIVRRNRGSGSLQVSLTSSDTTEATVPTSVTLPANVDEISFVVRGASDGVTDGSQTVIITASAVGLAPARATLIVSDVDLPDLNVTAIHLPIDAVAGERMTLSWTVRNDGLKPATTGWHDRVFLGLVSNADPDFAGQFFRGVTLAPGAEYTGTLTVTAPALPGDFSITIVTDARASVPEILESNNQSTSLGFRVAAPYQATVATPINTGNSGDLIPLQGRAFFTTGGQPAANVPVSIRIMVQGIRRVLDVTTDAAGNLITSFQSLPGEAGRYSIGAAHPDVEVDPAQDEFQLVGLAFTERDLQWRIFPGEPFTARAQVENLGDLPLNNLTGSVTGAPAGVSVVVRVPNLIPAHGFAEVEIAVDAAETVPAQLAALLVTIVSQEGARAQLAADLNVAPPSASFVTSPGTLDTTMLRGQQKVVDFLLSNIGGGGSGEIEILVPNVPWLRLSSPSNLPSLRAGESNKITLVLTPPADLPLTRYDGSLVIRSPATGIKVPFSFRAISDAKGDLKVTVEDELTYYAAGSPKVTNATVRVLDGVSGDVVATGKSDANGQFTANGLMEGVYTLDVSAEKHFQVKQSVQIIAGETVPVRAFLDRIAVSYRWSVVPSEVDDKYRITLESVFETEVPYPVVTVLDPLIIPLVIPGEDTQFEIRVRNEGLIQAENVELVVPEHPFFELQPLLDVIAVLPAKTTLSIPVLIRSKRIVALAGTRATPSGAARQQQLNRRARQSASGQTITGCDAVPKIEVKYMFKCGPDNRWHTSGPEIMAVCADKDCIDGILDAATGGKGGKGGGGGGKGGIKGNIVAAIKDKGCDIAEAMAGCVDPCVAAIASAACRIVTLDVGGAAAAALGAANCICPPLPSLPPTPSTGPGVGIPAGGGVGGAGIGSIGTPEFPVGWPFTWEYPGCQAGDTFSSGTGDGRRAAPAASAGAVCARVRLQIQQEAVVTRAAFLGTLELDNAQPDAELRDIRVTLDIQDDSGAPANHRFAIRPPELTGLNAVDGSGRLAPNASGSARFTFIPNRDAAPDGSRVYRIGGTLRYREGDAVVEVPLLPDTITVFPDPVLELTYFQQKEVFSDNPFTDEIEPAEPFTLGLLVKNTGKGDARSFTITSAQPKIIENEKGLLVDFKILGTQVGDEPLAPSLTVQFGAIPAGTSKVGVWEMVSTLEGKFIEYTARYEHLTSLGDARLSLIDKVEIRELIHKVVADRPGDDAVADFLVNDVPDSSSLPDTLYLSSGGVFPVNPATSPVVTPEGEIVTLAVTVNLGWNYLRLPDPGGGRRLTRVERSDGKVLRVPENAWQTDRTFVNATTAAIRERNLHLFDFGGTGSYKLYFRAIDAPATTLASLSAPNPFLQAAAINELTVGFSSPIDLATFTAADVKLERDGVPVVLGAGIGVAELNPLEARIAGLAAHTATLGRYVLTVAGSGIVDAGGVSVSGTRSVEWARSNGGPVVQSIGAVNPSLRNQPVDPLDIEFLEPIDAESFSAADLTLRRDGGPNLAAGLTIAALNDRTYRVLGLAAITAGPGQYALTVSAAGITEGGISGSGTAVTRWTTDTTGPTIIELESPRTNPRNTALDSVEVEFSESIDAPSLSSANLRIQRNGGAQNLVTAAVALKSTGAAKWQIDNLAEIFAGDGIYQLTVTANGIRDLAGNSGSGARTISWTVDTHVPAAPTNLKIVSGGSPGLVASSQVTLTGTVQEPGLALVVRDLTTQTDLGRTPVAGTSFALTLNLQSAGRHELSVRAVDLAGNVSPSTVVDVFVDAVGPIAVISPVTPNPRTNGVATIAVTFTEPIRAGTFTREDLTLLRNGILVTVGAGVSITPVGATTFQIGDLRALTDVPGEYELRINQAGIEDLAGRAGGDSLRTQWLRRGANTAPALATTSALRVSPETLLVFTNNATDADLPGDRLRFELATGTASGATLNPTNGLFRWLPTRAQANSVVTFAIRVTDDGTPALSDLKTFTVTVEDFFELRIESIIAGVGTAAELPLGINSSAGITSLRFGLVALPPAITQLDLSATDPGNVSAVLTPQANGSWVIDITTAPGVFLQGQHLPAVLSFRTPAATRSAFIPVTAFGVEARAGTRLIPNPQIVNGRIILVGTEPLLDLPLRQSGNTLLLRLYAQPGSRWDLQRTSNLNEGFAWQNAGLVEFLTWQRDLPVDAGAGNLFHRLKQR